MFRLSLALAASAAAIITATATAPAFAQDSPTLRSILVADLSRDVDAFSEATRSEAKMIDSVPAEMPPLERLEKIGGTAQIEIGLNAKGMLTDAEVHASSGHVGRPPTARPLMVAAWYFEARTAFSAL
jgi:outer membrane biosynthesis protein TonB